jgi:hypothetical protein
LNDLQKLARDRGLEQAFAMELFTVEHVVQGALGSRLRGLVEHALEEVRLLALALMRAPPKA